MIEDIISERKNKRDSLIEKGINPYVAKVKRTHTIGEVLKNFSKLKDKKSISIVGRIKSIRNQGNIAFIDIEDFFGEIQIFAKKDNVKDFKILKKMLDIGDFISASGNLMKTKTGEKSLLAKKIEIISKSIRPIPDEYYGIEDKDTKFRKRYLDTIINKDSREIFVKKSKFWRAVRSFLDNNGFMEVDTPVLEGVAGGAEAEPFITHYNALNKDFYLRIALEISLKKMLIGGFEKIYEIGKIFRNEGIDSQHLQDYMQLEFYWAYADYGDLMKFVEKMYKYIIKETFGTLKLKFDGKTIDWGKKWKVIDYIKEFKKETKLDPIKATREELYNKANKIGIKTPKNTGKGRLIDLIYKKLVRPKLIQPSFLINLPVEISPLAKRDPKNPEITQRIQVMACGTELGNGFSELNDPIDQRERFEKQDKLREKGDKEAHMFDESFLEAMEYGMPPAAGFGMSERLFAILMDKPIREIVFLPPMKSKEN